MKRLPLRLFFSGFLATFFVTMVLIPIFRERLPTTELATLIVSRFATVSAAPHSAVWWGGLFEHFFNGVILFPLLYSVTLGKLLPKSPLAGGPLWGAVIGLVGQGVILPLAGLGVFGDRIHEPVAFGTLTLLLFVLYGLIFGAALGFSPRRRVSRHLTPQAEGWRPSA